MARGGLFRAWVCPAPRRAKSRWLSHCVFITAQIFRCWGGCSTKHSASYSGSGVGCQALLRGEFHPRAGVPKSTMTWGSVYSSAFKPPAQNVEAAVSGSLPDSSFQEGDAVRSCHALSQLFLQGPAFQAGRAGARGTIPTTPPAKTTLGIPWEPALSRASWYFLLPRPDPAGC